MATRYTDPAIREKKGLAPIASRARPLWTDDSVIKELHDAFDYATDAWQPIKDAGAIDMRFIGGDTWEPNDRQAREDAFRPCMSFDEFGQYVNQIINDVRQNKRAIKVTPLGNGANDQTAALRADLWRQIEYRSNAQQAYTTMFENAVQRGYGYLRVKPQYVSERSRHQELLIEPLVNPDLVTPDPDALRPDLSDMKYLFYQESWAKRDFKKRWPDAAFQDFSTDLQNQAARWVQMERILLAEWWKIRTKPRRLVYIDIPAGVDPRTGKPTPPQEFDVFEDEFQDFVRKSPLPQGARTTQGRMADVPDVTMCLTNGIEILEEHAWDGKYIPFVGCFGKIIYVNEGSGPEKRILSAIRLAEEPAQYLSYLRTCQAEQVGLSSKAPYFYYENSLSPAEVAKLDKSIHEPVGGIAVRMMGDSIPTGMLPPLPQRNAFEPAVQALEVLAEGARRAIQAGMGISPLPTSAQRRNEKSGVALKQIDESAQKGTFHFVDNLDAAITRVAVIGDDLIDHTYVGPRDVTVRKADDTAIQIRVGDASQPAKAGDDYAPEGGYPDLSRGTHDHTLSTGPSFDSQREAADDLGNVLVQNIGEVAQIAGPKAAAKIMALAIKSKNIGAFGDEMADTVSPAEAEGGPSPELQQFQQQAKQLTDSLMEKIQTLEFEKKAEIVKQQGQMQIEQLRQQTTLAKTEADNETKLKIEGIDAQIKLLGQQLAQINTQIDREREDRLDATTRADAHAHDHVTRIHEHQRDEREHRQQLEIADRQAAQAERDREISVTEADKDRKLASEKPDN